MDAGFTIFLPAFIAIDRGQDLALQIEDLRDGAKAWEKLQ